MADDKSDVKKADGGSQTVQIRNYGATASLTTNPNAVPDADAIQGAAFEKEDEYRQFYLGGDRDLGVLEPPYRLRQLQRLTQENNALGPCIEAMVTNIDGTGYDFDSGEDEADGDDDDTAIEELEEFFAQPWPGMSFKKMRRMVRRDVESIGNGYMEVLRNPAGEIVFIRPIDGKMMRMIKLDQATVVTKTLTRKGAPVEYKVSMRERRYCQLVNGITLVYFKEFGASRDLNKRTGVWAAPGQQLPANIRATEVLHFQALPDAHTPYGIPRWIAQVPSVMGSRKAEEFNLSYFDNGGVPPLMIVLQGGLLQSETRKKLEQMTAGTAAQNNRLQVVEVEPTGGSLEGAAPVAKVTVERFGSDRMADSMFENYDDKCEKRVRRAFRLSTVFIGTSEDLTFANAFAGYTVAEAQVFKPERDDFDELISMTLITDMGYEGYALQSKPLVIEDATLKLQAIEMGLGTGEVDIGAAIQELNEATGSNLKMMTPEQKAQKQQEAMAAMGGGQPGQMTVDATGRVVPKAMPGAPANSNVGGGGAPGAPGAPNGSVGLNANGGGNFRTPKPPGGGAGSPSAAVAKHDGTLLLGAGETIRELAHRSMVAMRKRDMPVLAECMAITSSFDEPGQAAFKKACAELHFVDTTLDPVGLGMLSACTMNVLAREGQPGGPFQLTKAEHDVGDEARDETGKWTAGGHSLASNGKLTAKDHETAVDAYVPEWVQAELNARTDNNHSVNGYKTKPYDTGVYVKPTYKSLADGGLPITQKQATLVASYTKGSDFRINGELRSGTVTPAGLAYAKSLNQTLTDLQNDPTGRFKAPATVYRGIKMSSDAARSAMEKVYQPGAVIQWNGFGSSATALSVAKDFAGQGYGGGILFKIKSENAVKVQTLSAFDNEKETIFKAGSRFKVDAIEKGATSDEPTVIQLTEEKKQDYKLYSGVKGDDTSAKDEYGVPIKQPTTQMGLGLTGGSNKPAYVPSPSVFKSLPFMASSELKNANSNILAAHTPMLLDIEIASYGNVKAKTNASNEASSANKTAIDAIEANIATKQKALGVSAFKSMPLDIPSTSTSDVADFAKANLTIKKAANSDQLMAAHAAAKSGLQSYPGQRQSDREGRLRC